MTKDNSQKIEKIPEITQVKRVKITPELANFLSPEFLKVVKKNSQKLFTYKITYKSQGHLVKGYIVEPRKGNKLPAVIFNRGGSGSFGVIKPGVTLGGALAKIALSGYIVFASQYSGNAGGEGKDEFGGNDLKDVLNLHKIIKAYKRADENRIGMYGGSRGGMMTYLSLKAAKWIRAAVIVAGEADLGRGYKDRPELKKYHKDFFRQTKAELDKRSAVKWIDKLSKKTPVLLMHGTADWRVNPLNSIEVSKLMLQNNIPHRLIMFEGADHGLSEFTEEKWGQTISWLDRFVKNKEPLPNLKPHGK